MRVAVFATFVAFFVTGCAQLMELQDKSADKAADAISAYCKSTDEEFRTKFRASVNEAAAPHSVVITCGE